MAEPRTPLRKLPGLDADNRAFWTAGADGRLMIARCGTCGYYSHPPLPRCLHCHGADVAPVAVSGRGRVAAYTVNHQPWVPGLAVPYVVAVVELEEQAGLHLFTRIVDCAPDRVATGMAVTVQFEQDEHIHLPMFRPLDAAA